MNNKVSQDPISPTELDSVFQTTDYEQWMNSALGGLSDGQTLDDICRRTLDDIAIDALYDTFDGSQPVSTPAPHASWDNRLSIHAEQEPAITNQHILTGLNGGINSIEIHTGAPQQLDTLLEGVDLKLAPISVRSGQLYQQSADQLTLLAKKQSIALDECSFSFNADPIGHALQQGGASTSLEDALRDTVRFSSLMVEQHPHFPALLVDTTLHHNAGASTVEELHAAIATATLYLEQLLEGGIDIDQALRQINFQLAMDCDVLMGVAKLRVLERLWRHVAQELGSDSSQLMPVSVTTETSKRVISHLDPWNNHLRNLLACMSAALASASTIIVHAQASTDKPLADRLARNLPIIVEREAMLLQVHDPLAGSYAIESLTEELMKKTWHSLQQTDTSQSWMNELKQGKWQARLQNTHARRVAQLNSEQQIMVGVNRYQPSEQLTDYAPDIGSSELIEVGKAYPMPALQKVRDAQAHESAASGD